MKSGLILNAINYIAFFCLSPILLSCNSQNQLIYHNELAFKSSIPIVETETSAIYILPRSQVEVFGDSLMAILNSHEAISLYSFNTGIFRGNIKPNIDYNECRNIYINRLKEGQLNFNFLSLEELTEDPSLAIMEKYEIVGFRIWNDQIFFFGKLFLPYRKGSSINMFYQPLIIKTSSQGQPLECIPISSLIIGHGDRSPYLLPENLAIPIGAQGFLIQAVYEDSSRNQYSPLVELRIADSNRAEIVAIHNFPFPYRIWEEKELPNGDDGGLKAAGNRYSAVGNDTLISNGLSIYDLQNKNVVLAPKLDQDSVLVIHDFITLDWSTPNYSFAIITHLMKEPGDFSEDMQYFLQLYTNGKEIQRIAIPGSPNRMFYKNYVLYILTMRDQKPVLFSFEYKKD